MNISKMWDEKFSRDGYLYGKEPNLYLKEIIDTLPRGGRILFLGEGEGRNACYAAEVGFVCSAIDASAVAIEKLQAMAKECGVAVQTLQLDLVSWVPEGEYDAVLCSYMHLDEPLRTEVFVKALSILAPGGVFAGEFFAKAQLTRDSGGPKSADLLYACADFEKLRRPWIAIETLLQTTVELDEGNGHRGTADVVRVSMRRLTKTPFAITLPHLTLEALFTFAVERYGDRIFAQNVEGTVRLSYAEFAREVSELRARLGEAGIVPGDRVALCSENMPYWGVVYFAVTTMGAVIVPILPDFHENEVRHIITHAECRAVFVSRKMRPALDHESMAELDAVVLTDDLQPDETFKAKSSSFLRRGAERLGMLKKEGKGGRVPEGANALYSVREDDLAAIIYTSGTTGSSKGVMLNHRALAFQSLISQCIVKIEPEDRFLSILPMAHTYECSIGFLVPFANGASVTYLSKVPTPKILIDAMAGVKPTLMLSVPLVIEKIFKNRILPNFHKNALMRTLYGVGPIRRFLHRVAGKKLLQIFGGELRFFGIGGAPLSPMAERFLTEAGFPFTVGYGLTETAPLLAAAGVAERKLTGIGPAVASVSIRIDAEPGKHEGQILVKGPNIMLGYYKDPEKTAEVMDEEGWFNTEDLGWLDDEGHLFISGRSKNVILGPSGENIYPEQIEAKIMEHDLVEDALVYAEGKLIVARVHFDYEKLDTHFGHRQSETSLHQDIDALLDEIKTATNANLSKFSKISKMIEQRSAFEKTPTKKIKRYLYTSG